MATVKNGETNVVETPEITTGKRFKRAAVSTEKFMNFVQTEDTSTMTQAEAAEKLGMTKLSFSQRLNQYRKDIKRDIDVLKNEDPAYDKKFEDFNPQFKSDRRGGGRKGQKKAHSVQQEALLSFLRQ